MEFKALDDLFARDDDKAKNGVEIEIGFNQNDDPIVMIVSDINHPDAQKIHRKYEKAFENSRHIPKKRQLVWARYLSEAVLKGWKGVIDENGQEVPATFENKMQALIKYERLFNEVLRAADSPENFQPDTSEIDIDQEVNVNPEEDTEKN